MSLVDPLAVRLPKSLVGRLLSRWSESASSSAGQRLKLAMLSAAGAGALTVLYFSDPSAGPHPWFPPCPVRAATGWYCPGCGSTRGLHHLLHGHIIAACRMNALMVLCIPFLAYAYLAFAARVCFPEAAWTNPRRTPIKAVWIWSLLVVILLYWVLRNLPLSPFTSLAPH
jgi:hypothetical protein